MKKWKIRRQTISERSRVRRITGLLAVAFLLASPAVASAQVDCLGKCEQQLALCVQNGGSEPGADCLSHYDACVDACLGGSAGVLG